MQLTFPVFGAKEIENVQACLDSKWVTQGPFVKRFEEMIAARHQVAYAHAVTSCTAALHLATVALGLGPGDEVVVPAFTWITSANCVEYVGARAVFADVDPATFNLQPEAFEAAITTRTKAVVAVHLFGLPADMDAINAIARKHGLAVIEDAACAIGSTYMGKPVGGLGDIGCFSFHPRKVITTGEGGMATTNSKPLSDLLWSLKNHGSGGYPAGTPTPPPPHVMDTFPHLGFNYRLSDIQAAVGVAQAERLDQLLAERAGLAQKYHALLSAVDEIACPAYHGEYGHSYQSYVVRFVKGGQKARNNTSQRLMTEHGIATRPGTHAVHCQDYYAGKYGLRPEAFPAALACAQESLTLPLFPGMTEVDQRRVVDAVKTTLLKTA